MQEKLEAKKNSATTGEGKQEKVLDKGSYTSTKRDQLPRWGDGGVDILPHDQLQMAELDCHVGERGEKLRPTTNTQEHRA